MRIRSANPICQSNPGASDQRSANIKAKLIGNNFIFRHKHKAITKISLLKITRKHPMVLYLTNLVTILHFGKIAYFTLLLDNYTEYVLLRIVNQVHFNTPFGCFHFSPMLICQKWICSVLFIQVGQYDRGSCTYTEKLR